MRKWLIPLPLGQYLKVCVFHVYYQTRKSSTKAPAGPRDCVWACEVAVSAGLTGTLGVRRRWDHSGPRTGSSRCRAALILRLGALGALVFNS